MKIETIEIKKITAADGNMLTNGESFGKVIFLGENDSAQNWSEISEEEYLKINSEKQTEE